MDHSPLVIHPSPADTLAYRETGAGQVRPVAVREFLADITRVAATMPAGGYVLNTCADRYRFAVTLAAAIVSDRISLLPSTHTAEMVRRMRDFAPDVFCVTDQADSSIDLPTCRYPEAKVTDAPAELPDLPVPQIPDGRKVAYVFTSGSTGAPVPHAKHWGNLVRNAQAEARQLGLDAATGAPRHAIVGTVPPQHMFGFESTVLLALQSGAALHGGRPFYPADISAALAAVPRPRILVTTPFHLRSLLAEEQVVPPADLLLSATAPLSEQLARQAEECFCAPLMEIYGSTETGQIATRRTTAGAAWKTFPGVRIHTEPADAPEEPPRFFAAGLHLDQPVPLGDILDLRDAENFLLLGRSADLINIAGKRTSLAYLNHQLTAITGVADGAFLMPDEEAADGVTRLTAFVVAPGLSAATIIQALRERIDPVFLPRPLVFVDALPRNATGKLPREALKTLKALQSGSHAPTKIAREKA